MNPIYLNNVLNEVLHGLAIDRDSELGINKTRLEDLVRKLNSPLHESNVAVSSFSVEEARLLLKCSELCLVEIEGCEFDTRLGESRDSANETNRLLSTYTKAHGPQK